MPVYTIRQVREARIAADNVDMANYVGSALVNGEPTNELAGSDNWELIEDAKVVVFVVELEETG